MDQQKILIVGCAVLVAVCGFEFVYLLFTNTAWAVVPFSVGIGSVTVLAHQ